jgi:hypothetical protein
MRVSGLALAVASTVTVSACFATSASALAPRDFGRCVKLAKGEGGGEYSDHNCTQEAGAAKRFHWVPGPGAKAGFAGSAPATIAQVQGGPTAIQCAHASVTGQYTGTTSEALGITFTGCQLEKQACGSEGAAAGEVVTLPLEGELVMVKTESLLISNIPGIVWRPALGETFASFQCGVSSIVLSGSVLYENRKNKMQSSEPAKIRVVRKNGWNLPSCYETCSEHPAYLSASVNEAAPVVMGLDMPITLTNEEAIEASTVN